MRITFILLLLSIILSSCGGPSEDDKIQCIFTQESMVPLLSQYCFFQHKYKATYGIYADNATLEIFLSEIGAYGDDIEEAKADPCFILIPIKVDLSAKDDNEGIVFYTFSYEISDNAFKVTATPSSDTYKTFDRDHTIDHEIAASIARGVEAAKARSQNPIQ